MWRSIFLAIGITLCIIGVESMLIEKAFWAKGVAPRRATTQVSLFNGPILRPHDELVPAEWAPWAFLSAGAVVILYCFTIPQRHAAAS